MKESKYSEILLNKNNKCYLYIYIYIYKNDAYKHIFGKFN